MKNLKFTLLTAFMLVFGASTFAQLQGFKIRILEKSEARQMQAIARLEIDHYTFDANGFPIAIVSEDDLKGLEGTDLKVERVTEANVTKIRPNEIDQEANRGAFEQRYKRVTDIIVKPAAFNPPASPTSKGGYWSYNQMVTMMGNLKTAYPTIVDTFGIGFTYENRRILVVKISDNVASDENEPEVLFLGLQHAREAIGGSSMIFLMQYLAERYAANDPKIVNLVQNREIFIIPCFNADGWDFNWTSGVNSNWRKNRRPQGGGNIGVDLNRNWGVDWGNCPSFPSSCGSLSAADDTYIGSSAFSEPETRALRDFVYTRRFTVMIDQHSFGPYYSLPFGRPSLHTMATDDANFYLRIPSMMGKYNGMRAGNSPEAVNYEVAGGVKDWMLLGDIGVGTKGKVYGMTGEGGAAGGSSTGNDFWPRRDSIVRLCQGMTFQNLQLALAAGSYADIQDQGDLSVSSRNGNFSFTVRRVGVGNDPITVSLVPLENVGLTGDPVTINSIPTYYGTYTGNISYALPWTISNGQGQRLRYIWRVTTGGITYDDTVTKFYNPVQMVYDDMENTGNFASNWAINGGAWAYSNSGSGAFQGSRSLQESPGTTYGTSANYILTNNTVLDLSNATQAYLSFWTRYRAENGRDKLRLEISLNNGSTWLTIPTLGSHTVQEYNDGDGSTMGGVPGLTGIRDIWTKVTYDLTEYAGPARTQVRFRLHFTSDGDPTPYDYERDDGFYIDNLQVIKSTVPMSILPVRFEDVRGKLLANRTIEVSWEAETDGEHAYFEVERSADGRDFKPIGKVSTVSATYRFIDNSPLAGNNFYRIKQYDKNGNFNISQVVNVKNVYKSGVEIYPNPVTQGDLLTIKPTNSFTQPVNVRVTDAQGRVVFQKFVHQWPASEEIRINTASWSPQIYVLKITNNRGEFITVEKILKK